MKRKTLMEVIVENTKISEDLNIGEELRTNGLPTGIDKSGKFVYKPKQYRVHVTLESSGEVRGDDVYMRTAEQVGPGRSTWKRSDKRQFTRRILNTTEQFKVK